MAGDIVVVTRPARSVEPIKVFEQPQALRHARAVRDATPAIEVRPRWPSLRPLDRLPPALRGVQRLSNFISAWPYGQAHVHVHVHVFCPSACSVVDHGPETRVVVSP